MIRNRIHTDKKRMVINQQWRSIASVLLLLICCLVVVPSHAQKRKTREQLEEEKRKNIAKLEKTAKILQDTKSERKASLGQLNAIKQKEKLQKSLIRNITEEVSLIETEMSEDDLLLGLLKGDLINLKKEYAEMVYEASKASNTYSKLMFIFTSSNFYNLQMRLNYLAQYNTARKNQVEQITKVTETINEHIVQLDTKKEEKKSLLQSKQIEQKNLSALETQKEKVVKELSVQEDKLKKKIEKQREDISRLNKIIETFIKKEIENTPGTKDLILTKEEKLLAANFEGNKGHHLWPVQYGFISSKFGEHWHPTVAGVKVINIGIDIQTKKGTEVRCIYDGKVLAVASVPGMNKMVMVQHGDYFTVYTKIINVAVKTGQMITRKDPVGIAYTNGDGVAEMQFQVWKNAVKLDPEKWLSPLK